VFWCLVPHFCLFAVCSVCVGRFLVAIEICALFPACAGCSGALSHTSACGSVCVGFLRYRNVCTFSCQVHGFAGALFHISACQLGLCGVHLSLLVQGALVHRPAFMLSAVLCGYRSYRNVCTFSPAKCVGFASALFYIPTVCSVCAGVLVVIEMWVPFPAGAGCSGALSHTSAVWLGGVCSYGSLSHLSPRVQGVWHFVL